MGMGVHRHATAALPPAMPRCPLYRRLGGSQGPSGRVRNISFPLEFDHRTAQPVASRGTDWAILSLYMFIYLFTNWRKAVGFQLYLRYDEWAH
jgi:hypothetical protein